MKIVLYSVVEHWLPQFCFHVKFKCFGLKICLIYTRIALRITVRVFLFNTVAELWTDPVRSVCTAAARYVSSSLAIRSPSAARQSSIEVSGLAGLNTSDVWRSKPVLEKAANTQTTGQNDISDRQYSSLQCGVVTQKPKSFYQVNISGFVKTFLKSHIHSDMMLMTHKIQTILFFRQDSPQEFKRLHKAINLDTLTHVTQRTVVMEKHQSSLSLYILHALHWQILTLVSLFTARSIVCMNKEQHI